MFVASCKYCSCAPDDPALFEALQNNFPVMSEASLNTQFRSIQLPSLNSTGHKSRLSLDSATFQNMSEQVNAFNKRPSQCGRSDYPGMHGIFLAGLQSITSAGPLATLLPVVSNTLDDYEQPAKRLSISGQRGSQAPSPSTSERRLSGNGGSFFASTLKFQSSVSEVLPLITRDHPTSIISLWKCRKSHFLS
jgi:hypothetical protein